MTIPYWGKVTPSQMFMLMLAGHVLDRRFVASGKPDPKDDPDEARLASMRMGRDRLRRLTGHDCGYDLGRWHQLLLGDADDEWGYRHPYAWRSVRPAIEEAINDPDRLRLLQMLAQQGLD
jgi:hypothetical protein